MLGHQIRHCWFGNDVCPSTLSTTLTWASLVGSGARGGYRYANTIALKPRWSEMRTRHTVACRQAAHARDIDLSNATALPKSRESASRSQSHANSVDGSLPPFLTKPLLTFPFYRSYARPCESHMNNISLVLQAESHPQIGYALQVPSPRFSYLTFSSQDE